jgi:hypothetical protein
MKNKLVEELDRMRKLAGLIKEGSEQSTANTADGAQKQPMQIQSPSIGSSIAGVMGQTPIAKQPAPSEEYTEEEMDEIIGDESDYPNTKN